MKKYIFLGLLAGLFVCARGFAIPHTDAHCLIQRITLSDDLQKDYHFANIVAYGNHTKPMFAHYECMRNEIYAWINYDLTDYWKGALIVRFDICDKEGKTITTGIRDATAYLNGSNVVTDSEITHRAGTADLAHHMGFSYSAHVDKRCGNVVGVTINSKK